MPGVEPYYGIEESTKFFTGLAKLGNAAGKSFADGSIGLGDLFHLREAMTAANLLVSIDYGLAFKEWKDWDSSEREQLCATLKEELDIPQDSLEEIAENVVCYGLEFYEVLKKVVDLVGSFLPGEE